MFQVFWGRLTIETQILALLILLFAWSSGIENLLLEGDSTLVTQLVFHGKKGLWKLNSWLCKSIDMVISLHRSLSWIPYIVNQTRDSLSK